MKKNLIIALLFTITIALCCCNGNKSGSNAETDSLRTALNDSRAEMEAMNLFLEAVKASTDSVVNFESSLFKTTNDNSKSHKEQIIDNIINYKQILQRQNERLANLEKKLKNGGAQAHKMLDTIEALKKQIGDKDKAIAQLVEELGKRDFDIRSLQSNVASLNTRVAALSETTQSQKETIEAQSNTMNEAYYIIGSKKQLKEAGLLSGGSLFKKSKLDMNTVSNEAFTKIDIRKTKSFQIPGKNAQLLTQAPAGSYELTANADGTSTLTITDPAKFWSISNYLIVRY